MNQLLLAADAANEGDGVNVLPIALAVIALALLVYLWRRRRA